MGMPFVKLQRGKLKTIKVLSSTDTELNYLLRLRAQTGSAAQSGGKPPVHAASRSCTRNRRDANVSSEPPEGREEAILFLLRSGPEEVQEQPPHSVLEGGVDLLLLLRL